ncbi:MAG: DUF3096 domain-containing protein [Bryobacterales bacterium]|nr:DUF3096 domain-containing protein [Bryobacterales bacterium]
MTLRQRVVWVLVLIGVQCVILSTALAQTRGGALTVRYTAISPFIALLAGILILIMPRLLNYIVALYLILIGLVGIFGF